MTSCMDGDGVQPLNQPSQSLRKILHWCSFHCL